MSKLSSPTRRALMLAAPVLAADAVAAIAALPQGTAHLTHSAEFLEYRRRFQALCAIFGAYEGATKYPQFSEPALQVERLGYEAWEGLEAERTAAIWEAVEILLARPVVTLADVIEFGLVVYDQLWDENTDSLSAHSSNSRWEPAFMQAFMGLARGEIRVAA
jgi:hypothetical protein